MCYCCLCSIIVDLFLFFVLFAGAVYYACVLRGGSELFLLLLLFFPPCFALFLLMFLLLHFRLTVSAVASYFLCTRWEFFSPFLFDLFVYELAFPTVLLFLFVIIERLQNDRYNFFAFLNSTFCFMF